MRSIMQANLEAIPKRLEWAVDSLRRSRRTWASEHRATSNVRGTDVASALTRDSQHSREASLYIGISRRPRRYADSHRGLAMPRCSAAPACAVLLNRLKHSPGPIFAAKGHEYLIKHNVVQNGVSGLREFIGKPGCMSASSFNQVGNAGSPQGTQGCPNLNSTGTVRSLRRVLPRLTGAS